MRWRPVLASAALLAMMGPQESRADGPLKKLGRGTLNVALGWMELPVQIVGCPANDRVLGVTDRAGWWKVPACVAAGTFGAVIRTAVGAVEVVTFPMPWPTPDYSSALLKTWELSDSPLPR